MQSVGTPAANTPAIAPLAAPLETTISGGGGTGTADSRPGGGGGTLVDCMAMWDGGTHMTKPVWRQACQRTLNGIDLLGETKLAEPRKDTRRAHHNHNGSRSGS